MSKLADPVRRCSLLLLPFAKGDRKGHATGFVIKLSAHYLVTNWHVLTDRCPRTGKRLHPDNHPPDELVVSHHSKGTGGIMESTEKLFNPDGSPRWFEHPARGVDVVLLPLESLDNNQLLYPLDLSLAEANIAVPQGTRVAIVGYPEGTTSAYAGPTFDDGYVRRDPDKYRKITFAFTINATATPGMSGSPVLCRVSGHYLARDGSNQHSVSPLTRFLGIYSGTHVRGKRGKAWRPRVVWDIAKHSQLD